MDVWGEGNGRGAREPCAALIKPLHRGACKKKKSKKNQLDKKGKRERKKKRKINFVANFGLTPFTMFYYINMKVLVHAKASPKRKKQENAR
jgi:hypothetical protein